MSQQSVGAGRPTETTGASAKCDTGGRSTHKGHWDATKSNNEILRRGVAEFLDLSHIFKPKFARCPSQLVRPGAAGEDYKVCHLPHNRKYKSFRFITAT